MYLSDREMEHAIKCGRLIVDPPTKIGPTSIDLHLDKVDQAKVWDIDGYRTHNKNHGIPDSELRIASYHYGTISKNYQKPVPADDGVVKVFRRDRQIVVRPTGFLLWQTKEVVGTPKDEADLILFIDGKSTRTARTGVLIHFTAPTIHAGWGRERRSVHVVFPGVPCGPGRQARYCTALIRRGTHLCPGSLGTP